MERATVDLADVREASNASLQRALEFVALLAAELARAQGPHAFNPQLTARVHQVLADEATTIEQVVRLLKDEPAIAARLIAVSNSAALRRASKRVTDVRGAVRRLGYDLVRTVVTTMAVARLVHGHLPAATGSRYPEGWERISQVAALTYVLARRFTDLNADQALLQGLVVGLQHVSGAAEIEAAAAGDVMSRPESSALHSVAVLAARLLEGIELAPLEEFMAADRQLRNLGLEASECIAVPRESAHEIELLRHALVTGS